MRMLSYPVNLPKTLTANLLSNRWFAVRGEIGRSEVPKPINEVVEGTDARNIPGLKSAEDSKEC